ncbi:uncharacterized protein LOC135161755 [Diachasmimorpha longicaudata]|uniref:uncharacterized protein LOC135161755 n=1 Tax=Diachasmimorpha longicaudata TaxID=58733 RepID=UPI0030B8EFF7
MENDTWAQTLFTITPEEDGFLREITETTIISAPEDSPLILDTDHIAHRETLVKVTHDFIDPRELEKAEFQETEVQTYMKGISKVEYVISHQDEAIQTLYIGRNCPPPPGQTARTVVNVLNKKTLPKLKTSQLTQTIITVLEDLPQHEILKGLMTDITDDEQNDPQLMVSATEDESLKIETSDLINFVIDRTLWMTDTDPEVIVQTDDMEIQTTIKHNNRTKGFMFDFEGQTSVTLEPSKSTSKLLDDYLEVKGFIEDLLEGSVDAGVYNRMLVDDVVDEIVDRCSEFVRLPARDEAIQTLASGRPFDAKDDEILKTLRRSVISDPVEAAAMVLPIVDGILNAVSEIVATDARDAAEFVLGRVVGKSCVIGKKLDDIQNIYQGPPIDEIFTLRKRKLLRSMRKKKETEDASTQTGLAGVPQLRKFQENKEVVCCVCPTPSNCHWCLAEEVEPPKETKVLRTQDILLAYKPCYVVMNPTEATPDVKRPCSLEESAVQINSPIGGETPSESLSSYEPCPCLADVEEKPQVSESTSGWSRVVDTALADAWVFPETPSKGSKSTTSTRQSQSNCRPSKSEIPLPKSTIEALQVLKSTFCTQETCPVFNIIEDPKHMSPEMVPQTSRRPKRAYICTDHTPPDSDECICDFLNKQIQEKLKTLSMEMRKTRTAPQDK